MRDYFFTAEIRHTRNGFYPAPRMERRPRQLLEGTAAESENQ